ncbi:HIRAN domain-containing protein [Polyangium spumosum]|nr:HIRAN domain-containing protein [Polyangium spumosum]
MSPIIGFPDTSKRYVSADLFPIFKNRIMSRSRGDYPVYIERLGLTDPSPDPLLILARSEGHKVTDSYYLFPQPTEVVSPSGERRYSLSFFVHGMKYVREEARARAMSAPLHEKLFLLSDLQNPADPAAMMIRTSDNHLLGWVPRYYCSDLQELWRRTSAIELTVEHVNPAPTPSWLVLMCRVEAPWPEGFHALSAPEYEPLAESARDAGVAHGK